MIQSSWQTKKLSEIGIIFNGNSINERVKKEKYFGLNEGFPFIATKDVDFETHSIDYENGVRIPFTENGFKIAHKNSILVCAEGGSAWKKVAFNERDICFGNKLFALETKTDVAPKFVYYWYLTDDFANNFKGLMNGLIWGVSMNNFKTLQIPVPPLSEQLRIVTILDEALEKFEQAKENIEKNLQNAKEVFESYLQGVFANPGEDWEEKRLGDILQKTETVDPTKKPDEKFVYLDVSSVNKDTKEIENPSVLFSKDAPSRARKLIKTDDVIFATVRPTHARVALIREKYNNQVCSTGYFVLRAKEFINNNLIFYYLLTSGFNKQMEKLQKGASYPAVTDNEVKGIIIPFPKSLSKQQSIVTQLDTLSTSTKRLASIYQQKLIHLDELRKSLLKKAFSGEL